MAVAVPSLPPLTVTSVTVVETVRAAGSVIVALSVAVAPLLSVTVTVYIPAITFVIVADVALLLHK